MSIYLNLLSVYISLDDHAPLKTRTVKLQSESPSFNDDIRAARKTRRQLERKWRDNGKACQVHRQEYRNQHDIKLKTKSIVYHPTQELTNL